MSYLKKHSDKVDVFIKVCHHLAAHQYVTGHGGNLAWKLEDDVILITPTKHNKGDVNRDNVVFLNLAGETIEGSVPPTSVGGWILLERRGVWCAAAPRLVRWAQRRECPQAWLSARCSCTCA